MELLPSLCEEPRRRDFIIQLAETQNCPLNSPLRGQQLPHPPPTPAEGVPRKTRILSLATRAAGTLQPPLPPLRGRWERLSLRSQSSPTLATFSCVQVLPSMCRKEGVRGQRCPVLLLSWVVGTVSVNSPLASSTW